MDSVSVWPRSVAAVSSPTVDARAASGCPLSAAVVCGLDHLKRRSDFIRVAREGRSRATPGLVVQACRRDQGEAALLPARVGVTVTRKIGNSVTRNRVRRRLRAVARSVMPTSASAGFDYVLIGRAATVTRAFAALIADLEAALRGLAAGRGSAIKPAAARRRRPRS